MDANTVHILLIEDNPGDARLVQEMLSDEFGDNHTLEKAETLAAGLKKLFAGGVDIVLLDLTLPDSRDLHTLNWVQIQSKGAPVIVLTGTDDEKLAIETVKYGAQDYLVKGRFDGKALVRSIRYALERQRLTRDLLAAQEDLERTKRLSEIGSLAAAVAHRLRTPLAAIEVAAFNIKSKLKDASLACNLETIEKKVHESDLIVKNLLFYSAQLKKPRLRDTNVHEMVDACIDEARKQFPSSGIIIKKKYTAPEAMSIKADDFQLKELLCNIITNAFEALEERGGIIEIKTECGAEDTINISIKDDGEGIDAANIKKVCDPFFTTKVTGMGLGLTVCAQIVRMHEGSMDINSVKGEGTTVTVTLPVGLAK